MARIIQAAAAQMGPIAKSETRKDTVRRLIAMMREAKGSGAELVVFTELALTTFFPRWLIEDEAELDGYYETRDARPGHAAAVRRSAKALGVGFYLGYARTGDGRRQEAPLQHLHPGRHARATSSASIARCICRDMPSRSRAAGTSIWRSAISNPAISASGSGAASAG